MVDRPRPRPRPGQRPVAGSRTPASRPRKVASRLPDPVAEPVDDAPPGAGEPDHLTRLERDPGEAPHHGVLDSLVTTAVLVAAIVLLIGGAVLLVRDLWFGDEPVPSSTRPVTTGEIAHRAGVEAASQDVAEILTYGYQDFDERIAAAQKLMTPGFANKFAETAGDVRDRFQQGRISQEVKVRAAGVVQASPTQVKALLFLDSFVTKGSKSDTSTYTPYRAMVTMVHTEHGWLVDNIDTR